MTEPRVPARPAIDCDPDAGPPAPPLTLHVSRAATLDVVLQGEIDFGNAPAILEETSAAIRRRRPAVVRVDLAGITYFDSTAVRMLVRIASVAEEVAATIRMENASPAVRRVLEVTGLWQHFGLSEP